MSSILIVDDEPAVVRVMKLGLENAGYEVVTARHGEDAMARLRERSFDVMITDMNMPRMNGQELCDALRKELPDREPLIFVLSARTGLRHREWHGEIDGVEFLEKPASMRQLSARIRERLEEAAGKTSA